MPVQLYYTIASPPARAVMLTLKNLDIPHELHNVNLLKGEHKSDEFLKINPQHTVPTLVDEDGFVVLDSHAINAYLVGKYGKDDKLYPSNVKVRSVVDHRLHFDTGVLFQAVRYVSKGVFWTKTITSITPEIVSLFDDAYEMLEKFLNIGQFIAGNQVTIADFSVITTLANMAIYVPVKKDKFPLVLAYIQRCSAEIPFCSELNDAGIQSYKSYLKEINFPLLSQ